MLQISEHLSWSLWTSLLRMNAWMKGEPWSICLASSWISQTCVVLWVEHLSSASLFWDLAFLSLSRSPWEGFTSFLLGERNLPPQPRLEVSSSHSPLPWVPFPASASGLGMLSHFTVPPFVAPLGCRYPVSFSSGLAFSLDSINYRREMMCPVFSAPGVQ